MFGRNQNKFSYRSFAGLFTVIIFFAASVMIVGISGNFPLNDDWSFAAAARSLVIGHDWRPTGWTSMTLVSQSIWAAPFCSFDHCSYEVLRIATLSASALLLVLCTFLFQLAGANAWYETVGVVVAIFNPLSFALQFTFMTETLFCLLLTSSLFSFMKYLNNDGYGYYFAGCAMAVAAIMCRQLELCIPLAFALICMLHPGERNLLRRALVAAFPLVLSVSVLILFSKWMAATGRTPAQYGAKSNLIANAIGRPLYLVQRVIWNLTVFTLYLGLFVSPLTIGRVLPRLFKLDNRLKRVCVIVACLFVLLFVSVMVLRKSLMPIGGNILGRNGIGPMLLYGLDTASPPDFPLSAQVIMTLVSLFGAARIIYIAGLFFLDFAANFRARLAEPRALFQLFCILSIVIYFAPISSITFYDRYVVPMIAPLCVFLLLCTSQPTSYAARPALAAMLCALIAGFSILATHDYMSWNRARWLAIANLENVDAGAATNLNGGFEYDGPMLYSPKTYSQTDPPQWWLFEDTYQVTFGPIPGEKILKDYAYSIFLPPCKRDIYVMEKQ